MSKAVIAKNLVKRYKSKIREGFLRSRTEVVEALRGVSFEAYYGEVLGLLGPNGAGKTTTIKILATLLLPDEGEAYVAGHSVVEEPDKVRRNIGLMLTVEKGFYGKLTGRENLEYFAALYGLDPSVAKERIDYLMRLLELDKLGADKKLFEEFSLGMKARLSLARALLSDAPIIFLDEPTLGLDPPSARKIRELVKTLARERGKAIIYTTHNMFEAEIVCDRILLINKGVIVAEGSPSELKSRIPAQKIIILLVRGRGDYGALLSDLGARVNIEVDEHGLNVIRIHARNPEDLLSDVLRRLVGAGAEVVSARIEEPTLEDVFIFFSR